LKTSQSKGRPWKANKDSDDEEDGDLIPMSKATPAETCMEAEVQPGETLASVALKYNVPPAELKRVNNLLKDAEFYALKRIKIPVKPASLLTEILQPVGDGPDENGWYVRRHHNSSGGGGGGTLQSPQSSTTVQSSTPVSETTDGVASQLDPSDLVPVSQLIDLGGGAPPPLDTPPSQVSKEAKRANRFLRGIDKDLKRIKEKTEEQQQRLSPDRAGGEEEGELNLSMLTSSGDYMTTKLVMPVRHDQGGGAGSWCSKSGLCCALLIVISVMAIMALAHWLYFYHNDMFISHSEHMVRDAAGKHHNHSNEPPHHTDLDHT